jgi:hypothetical protein
MRWARAPGGLGNWGDADAGRGAEQDTAESCLYTGQARTVNNNRAAARAYAVNLVRACACGLPKPPRSSNGRSESEIWYHSNNDPVDNASVNVMTTHFSYVYY